MNPGEAHTRNACAEHAVVVTDADRNVVCWSAAAEVVLGRIDPAANLDDLLARGPLELPADAAQTTGGLIVHTLPAPMQRPEAHPRLPRLSIDLLGPTRVRSPDGALGTDWVRQRPGQLLKLLLVERGRPLRPEEIAEALWPSAGATALVSVRQVVHLLRKRLQAGASAASSTFVVKRDGGYVFDVEGVDLDVDAFERGLAAGAHEHAAGHDHVATALLERALSRYVGDFLADERYAEWALVERDRLRSSASDGLRLLAGIYLGRGDTEAAAHRMAHLAALEPFDLAAQKSVIALCLRRGRHSEAMRRFSTLEARMLSSFGEPLGFTLAELVQQERESETVR